MDEVQKSKSNKGLVVIIVILFVLILSLGGFGYYKFNELYQKYDSLNQELENIKTLKTTNNNERNEEKQDKNDFKFDDIDYEGGYGTATVTGYAELERNIDEDGNDFIYEYVYFHILDCESLDFLNFIDSHKGNTFVREKAIGLGSLIDNNIIYTNISGEHVENVYKLTTEETEKILNSTKEKPIRLELTRLPNKSGYARGADQSFSYITYIKIVE